MTSAKLRPDAGRRAWLHAAVTGPSPRLSPKLSGRASSNRTDASAPVVRRDAPRARVVEHHTNTAGALVRHARGAAEAARASGVSTGPPSCPPSPRPRGPPPERRQRRGRRRRSRPRRRARRASAPRIGRDPKPRLRRRRRAKKTWLAATDVVFSLTPICARGARGGRPAATRRRSARRTTSRRAGRQTPFREREANARSRLRDCGEPAGVVHVGCYPMNVFFSPSSHALMLF